MFARTLLQPRDRPRPGRPLSMKQRRPSQTLSALRWPTSAALETLRRVAMVAAGERTTLCCSHSRSLSRFVQLYPAYPCSPDWVDSCLSSKTPFLPNFLRSLHPPPLHPRLSLPSPLPPPPLSPPNPTPSSPTSSIPWASSHPPAAPYSPSSEASSSRAWASSCPRPRTSTSRESTTRLPRLKTATMLLLAMRGRLGYPFFYSPRLEPGRRRTMGMARLRRGISC